ncbi:hypothetical protein [Acetobacter okinawensis]|uniref:hypothetical protein n=1 Tax=Acetobacter okinawensis TaxID=1076594 RepID=UPI0039EA92C1
MVDTSQNGFALRIRQLLPDGWFPAAPAEGEEERAPVLNALLQGFGSVFAWVWGLLGWTNQQARLLTMSGAFLDMFAADFFGTSLPRKQGESDDEYRKRIQEALFPSLGTRPDVENTIIYEVGRAGRFIEPRNAADCKGVGSAAAPAIGGGYGYGASGLRYGSRMVPFQLFAQLPAGDTDPPSTQTLTRIAAVMPAGTIAWTQDVESLDG